VLVALPPGTLQARSIRGGALLLVNGAYGTALINPIKVAKRLVTRISSLFGIGESSGNWPRASWAS
jgi:hypothetical protein